MADAGLRPDEYAVYSVLFDEGRRHRRTWPGGSGMPPTTMSHFVRALLERGHAVREIVAADRRSYRLALTADGLRAHAAAGLAFREADRRFMAALAIDEGGARSVLVGDRCRRCGCRGRACARLGPRPRPDMGLPEDRPVAGGRRRLVAASRSWPCSLADAVRTCPRRRRRSRRRPRPPRRRPRRRRDRRRPPPRRPCRATTAGGPTSTDCSRRASGCTPTRGTGSRARPGSPPPTRSRRGSRR